MTRSSYSGCSPPGLPLPSLAASAWEVGRLRPQEAPEQEELQQPLGKRHAAGPQTRKRHAAGRQARKRHAAAHQSARQQAVGPQAVGPQAVGPQAVGPQAVGPQR